MGAERPKSAKRMVISIDQKLASPAGGGAAYSKEGLSTMVHAVDRPKSRHNVPALIKGKYDEVLAWIDG